MLVREERGRRFSFFCYRATLTMLVIKNTSTIRVFHGSIGRSEEIARNRAYDHQVLKLLAHRSNGLHLLLHDIAIVNYFRNRTPTVNMQLKACNWCTPPYAESGGVHASYGQRKTPTTKFHSRKVYLPASPPSTLEKLHSRKVYLPASPPSTLDHPHAFALELTPQHSDATSTLTLPPQPLLIVRLPVRSQPKRFLALTHYESWLQEENLRLELRLTPLAFLSLLLLLPFLFPLLLVLVLLRSSFSSPPLCPPPPPLVLLLRMEHSGIGHLERITPPNVFRTLVSRAP